MKDSEKNEIAVEKIVVIVLNIINPFFLIIVMILIKDRIHSLVGEDVTLGIGYIFSGFSLLLPFFLRKIYIGMKNKKQAEMVIYILYNIPMIFGFIYFLLGGTLRYSIGFGVVTVGYFLFAGKFIFGEENE